MSLFGRRKAKAQEGEKPEPIRAQGEAGGSGSGLTQSLFSKKKSSSASDGGAGRGGVAGLARHPLVLIALVSLGWYYLGVRPAKREAQGLHGQLAARQREVDGLKKAEADRAKAEAQRPAAAKPTLRIASDPPGADILINGAPAPGSAKTPALLSNLEPGAVQIVLRLAGHRDATASTTLGPEPADLGTIKLAPLVGGLSLSSGKSGVGFTLTGPGGVRRTGVVPAQLGDLPVGKYSLAFEHRGWQLPPREVEIAADGTQSVEASFPYSSLKLTSTPAGALVWEGRQRLGQTPLEWQELRAVTRTFGLLLSGYKFTRVTVDVPEGQAVVREVPLEKGRDTATSFGMPLVWIDGGAGGGYWAGRYEVRQSDWEAVLPGRNMSTFRGASRPVESISWLDAEEFCKRLTERERAAGKLPAGFVYDLPTEAQWDELSADAAPATSVVSHSQTLTGTADVGTSAPNALGIFDAVGNVWEWCRDNYDASGKNKSMRGGCWLSSANNFPSKATRSGASATYRDKFIGLRVVLVAGR